MHILDWRRLCPNATMLCQCHSSPHSHSRQAAALTGRQAPQASDHMHLLLLWDLSQTQSQSPSARASWNCHTISKTIKTKRNQVGFETIFPRPESWPFQESSEHSAAPYSSTSGKYSFFNANAPSPKQLTSSPLFLSFEVFPPRSNFRLVGPPQRLLHMLLPGAGFHQGAGQISTKQRSFKSATAGARHGRNYIVWKRLNLQSGVVMCLHHLAPLDPAAKLGSWSSAQGEVEMRIPGSLVSKCRFLWSECSGQYPSAGEWQRKIGWTEDEVIHLKLQAERGHQGCVVEYLEKSRLKCDNQSEAFWSHGCLPSHLTRCLQKQKCLGFIDTKPCLLLLESGKLPALGP